jgi:hypothetical protein
MMDYRWLPIAPGGLLHAFYRTAPGARLAAGCGTLRPPADAPSNGRHCQTCTAWETRQSHYTARADYTPDVRLDTKWTR